jgi:hypothetical protein
MTNTAQSIGLIEVVSIVVGLFVILGVFLALAKWIMWLTVKPIWEKLKELSSENKELRNANNTLKTQLEVASANNRTLVSQSMVEVIQEVGTVSTHYAEFRREMENRFSTLELDLAKKHVTKEDLEREFEICRKTTHGV